MYSDSQVCSSVVGGQVMVLDMANDAVDLAELQRSRFVICDRTPSGRFANLNAGAGGRPLYLCFRRGFGEPITHLAVIHALQEAAPSGTLSNQP